MPLFFVIYHYSPAQHKFLDIFSIPLAVFSGVGMQYISDKFANGAHKALFLAAIVVFLIVSLLFPIFKVHEYQSRFSAISPGMTEAAEWLGEFDSSQKRILLALNSSALNKESLVFESELVFSQISGKIPLDGTISDLEAYTPEHKKQLNDREKMIDGDVALIKQYNVTYVVSGAYACPFETIYRKSGIEICGVM